MFRHHRYWLVAAAAALTVLLAEREGAGPQDVYFGNFDDQATYNLVPGETGYAGWKDWGELVPSVGTSTTIGVTSGTQSLAWQPPIVGYYQGIAVKIQDIPIPLAERNAFIEGMLNNTHLAMNVTWDQAEWAAQKIGDIGTANYSQLFSLAFNYGPGGTYQDQSFPDIDTGNAASPGHWDPVNYPGVHNRVVMWDYSAHKVAIQALYTAGTMTGQNGWLEFMLTTNAGDYNYPVTYYLDSWRFTTPSAGLLGDFNDDGSVDAADYVIYRKNEGTTNTLPNDNGIGGTVGTQHYDLWRANFGETAPGGGAGVGAVPEPTAWLMAAIGAIVMGLRRRER